MQYLDVLIQHSFWFGRVESSHTLTNEVIECSLSCCICSIALCETYPFIIEDILFTKELLRIILSTEIPVLLGKGKYVVRQIIKTGFAGRKVL